MRGIVLAILCAFVQDAQPSAEEFFKKAQDRLLAAKSLTWKATLTGLNKKLDGKSEYSAEFACKGDGKFKLNLSGTDGGKGRSLSLLSDGTTWLVDMGRGKPLREAVPEAMGKRIKTIAWCSSWVFLPFLTVGPDAATPVDKALVASDFRFAPDEKDVKVIEYKLEAKAGGRDLTQRMKVWIDVKTHAIVKRTISSDDFEGIETFTKTMLDAAMEDKAFDLPKE